MILEQHKEARCQKDEILAVVFSLHIQQFFWIDMREIDARDVLFHKLKKHLKLSCCVTGDQL